MSVSTLSALPSMPGLPFSERRPVSGSSSTDRVLDQADEEDTVEEQKLMNILLRLKTAQSAQDTSRKRKYQQEVSSEAIRTFKQQRKSLLDKHNKRWTTRLNQQHERCAKLKAQIQSVIAELDLEMQACAASWRGYEGEIKRIEQDLRAIEQDAVALQAATKSNLPTEVAGAKKLVLNQLAALREQLQASRRCRRRQAKQQIIML